MAKVDLKLDVNGMNGLPRRTASPLDPDPECRHVILRYAREAARRAALRDPDRLRGSQFESSVSAIDRPIIRATKLRAEIGTHSPGQLHDNRPIGAEVCDFGAPRLDRLTTN